MKYIFTPVSSDGVEGWDARVVGRRGRPTRVRDNAEATRFVQEHEAQRLKARGGPKRDHKGRFVKGR